MGFYEFILFLACVFAVVWYCWRVTRVADALDQYAAHLDRTVKMDDALFLEVGRYVSEVLLPELTWRATLKQPDDERAKAAKQLVAALSARCAHILSAPDPLQQPAPDKRDATR
jgi:hypothetical protein